MAESEREKSKLKSAFFFFKPFIELEILEGKTLQKVKAAQEFGHVTLRARKGRESEIQF
jgi:hypothetical protein